MKSSAQLSPALSATASSQTASRPNTPRRAPTYTNEELRVSLLPGTGFAVEPVTFLRLLMIAFPLAVVSSIWQCLFILTTPFLEELGFSPELARLAWISVPVTGAIIIPTAGFLSDHCDIPYGRRRPFALAGFAFTLPSMVAFAFMGDIETHIDRHSKDFLALALFIVASAGLHLISTPLRAMISDVSLDWQHLRSHTTVSILSAVGRLVGSLLAYFMVRMGAHSMKRIFTINGILLTLSSVPLFTCFGEMSLSGLLVPSGFAVFRETFRSMIRLPRQLKLLCSIIFFAWVAWFCFLPQGSEFLAYTINTNPSEELGVQRLGLGLAIASFVEILSALLLWQLHGRLSRTRWPLVCAIALVLAGCALLSLFLSYSQPVSLVAIGSMGILLAVIHSLPFWLAQSQLRQTNQLGVYMGVLEMTMWGALLLDTLYVPFLWDVRLAMVIGSAWAFAGGIVAVIGTWCQPRTHRLSQPVMV